MYLPPDANCLLSVADHCLRSKHYVNVIVAGKQPALDYLTSRRRPRTARAASASGTGPSNDDGDGARRGDGLRRGHPHARDAGGREPSGEHLPELRVRVVNVVDLMRLQPESEHPHGMADHEFDALFTRDRPVIFAYHGYPG